MIEANLLSHTTLPGLPAPSGSDRPYTQPVQWLTWLERFGGSLPYVDPQDEFCRNLYLPTMGELLYRWEGMGRDQEIHLLYQDATQVVARARVQSMRRRELGVPDYDDPEEQRHSNFYNLEMCRARKDAIYTMLNRGYHVVVERVGSPQTGYDYVEQMRPIDGKTRALLDESLRDFIAMERLLTEQVTVRTGGETSIRDMMLEAMKENLNGNTAGGYSWDEVQVARNALPEADVAEGVVVD